MLEGRFSDEPVKGTTRVDCTTLGKRKLKRQKWNRGTFSGAKLGGTVKPDNQHVGGGNCDSVRGGEGNQ